MFKHFTDFIYSQFLVGSGSGDMFLVDIRGRIPFAGKYKGFCGSIKNIICPPTQNLIFSVSLDRHFRIHNFKTRKLLFKVNFLYKFIIDNEHTTMYNFTFYFQFRVI